MKYLNPIAKYKTPSHKAEIFARDVAAGVNALGDGGVGRPLAVVPLGALDINDVEFIAGHWRIQNDFAHKITTVRDRDFVIGKLLDRHEQNRFEYYSARPVGYNCYGPFVLSGSEFVVACFNGGAAPLWAYGPSIGHARAFLAISLFDRNRDMIFAAERGGMKNDKSR